MSFSNLQIFMLFTIIYEVSSLPVTSVALPPTPLLLSPAASLSTDLPIIPVNATGFTYKISALLSLNNTFNSANLWPDPPFALLIPNLSPTSMFQFQEFQRPGTAQDKEALLELIQKQIIAYRAQRRGLPNGFKRIMSSVKFSMELKFPKSGEKWMSMALAIGALQVFYQAVDRWGAEECYFVVVVGEQISEMQVKGSFRIEFLDSA
ncbi:hypothetical protein OEA41_010784 [Lepraria neglecta]|uniref:Uncharacterized protein n=1 Tax=Lepraria neglecta TaxID=209136 RepID=A0AAD9YZQ8_9LECA|nr:hypothetical protein OEA41_010784 [Lepraria neglecta]